MEEWAHIFGHLNHKVCCTIFVVNGVIARLDESAVSYCCHPGVGVDMGMGVTL